MGKFAILNEIYSSYFKDHKPARAVVEVSNLPKNAPVEIEAVAVIP
jgi:2-iminobutanoate/2-iminopropanoate deaminase